MYGLDGCTRRQHDDGRLCLHATATNKTLWCSSHTARPSGERVLSFALRGVDPLCSGGAGPNRSNSCGVHVHEGESCGADAGGHLYDRAALREDPWAGVAYTATPLAAATRYTQRPSPAAAKAPSSDVSAGGATTPRPATASAHRCLWYS